MDMLTEFWFMWNGHVRRVNIAKLRIEQTLENTQPIHSALYRVGLKAREFERTEIDKMLSQMAIEPAQTEWAAPVVTAH